MVRSNWWKSGRRSELPEDWPARRAAVRKRADGRCEHVSPAGVRCREAGTDADHAGDRMDHDNLQWLCPEHHKRKTAGESVTARRKNRRKGERTRRDDRPGAL